DEERKIQPAKSLMKGLAAGLIGGLVAAAAKTIVERIYPPHAQEEPKAPAVLAKNLAGHELTAGEETIAVDTIHWGFGALTGAAYGAVAEFYPPATANDGAGFGLALASLTHEGTLSAMGLSASQEEQTTRERTSEMASYAVF